MIERLMVSWHLYLMVTQNTLRKCEGKRSFLKLMAGLYAKKNALNRSDNACVPISELPSYIRTMFGLNIRKSIRIDIIQWIIEIKEIEIDRGGGV